MASFDVAVLSAPLDASAPCGPTDLEYDDDFLALEEAAKGRAEQQYKSQDKDTVIPAVDPDWAEMRRLALALFGRTRDLRVSLHLLRASVRLDGLAALPDGLQLLCALLEQQWEHVYPQLDPDDNDPTARLTALSSLVHFSAVPQDIRLARLPGDRTGVSGRMLELAAGKVQPTADETAPTVAALSPVLQRAEKTAPGFLAGLVALPESVKRLQAVLSQHIGSDPLDFKPLHTLVRALADVAQHSGAGLGSGATAAATGSPTPAVTAPTSGQAVLFDALPPGTVGMAPGMAPLHAVPTTVYVSAPPGSLHSREDALAALDRVCDWLLQHEPSNPAPLLIRRAQRLMRKNFFDIIRDLVPNGLEDIERIAGMSADEYTQSLLPDSGDDD